MFYALAGILLLLWFAGILTAQTLGGYIHLLLIAAIVVVLASLVYGETHS